MGHWSAVLMLISGGLFAGGTLSIAQERAPAWRISDSLDFRASFAHTLRRVDRWQPALLVVCLVAIINLAIDVEGVARTLAVLTAAGSLIVLVGSAAWLVQIQRRVVGSESGQPPGGLDWLRAQWLAGHRTRTAIALASFVLAAAAAVQ